MLQPGTVLRDTYEIERVQDQGAADSTYVATCGGEPKRHVVVKEFRLPGLTAAKREAAEKHAAQLKALAHPGLPAVLDFFEHDDALFLVLEHVEGLSLQARMLRDAPSVPQMVAWAQSLCDALYQLHCQEHPLSYHALQPDGIFIDASGKARLSEFGVAHLFDDAARASWMLHAASCMGFAAPEEYQPAPVEPSADVYALGAVLYFAITRMLPPSAALRKAGIQLEPATSFVPDLSPGIEAALTRALNPSPELRFASIRDFERALTGEACPQCSHDRNMSATICLVCGTEMAPIPAVPRAAPAVTPRKDPSSSLGDTVAVERPPLPFTPPPLPAASLAPAPAAVIDGSTPFTPPPLPGIPPQPAIPTPSLAPAPSAAPTHHLHVVEGAEKGRVVPLRGADLELGRADASEPPPNRILFAEPTISRLQAYLRYDTDRDRFTLEHEAKATNATLIHDEPIRQHTLRPGDVIRMGHLTLRYE